MGGSGADSIFGDTGDDKLRGNPGDDWLDGGPGTNDCYGGPGDVEVLACEPIFQTQEMNDRFASPDGKGGGGSATVRRVQQGALVFDSVKAYGLEPNTTYEVHTVLGPEGAFTMAGIITSKIVNVTTDGRGVLEVSDIHVMDADGSEVDKGTYRVDILITQPGYVAGSVGNAEVDMVAKLFDLDFLLACQPPFTVTVE